jgi:hypothetical protein
MRSHELSPSVGLKTWSSSSQPVAWITGVCTSARLSWGHFCEVLWSASLGEHCAPKWGSHWQRKAPKTHKKVQNSFHTDSLEQRTDQLQDDCSGFLHLSVRWKTTKDLNKQNQNNSNSTPGHKPRAGSPKYLHGRIVHNSQKGGATQVPILMGE